MPYVIELQNPKALLLADVAGLLRRAIEKDVLLAPVSFDAAAGDILHFVQHPDHFMLLGSEKGEFKAVVMGYFSTSNLFPHPTIVLFYNEGSVALRREMTKFTMDTIAKRGYTKALAVNGSGRSDRAWSRVMKPEGATVRNAGSLMMFEVE